MAFNSVRNYFHERLTRIKNEWKIFQTSHLDETETLNTTQDSDIKRLYHGSRDYLSEKEKAQALQSEYDLLLQEYTTKNAEKKEPFEFYSSSHFDGFPPNRSPAPGINGIPLRYHTGQTTTASASLPETGFTLHPLLDYIINHKYPQYRIYVTKYCRPLGTTDATFKDFNREQRPSVPIPKDRKERILSHIFRLLDAQPYLPVHFVDTQYAKLPLSTGTGYHNRHSYKINAHAKYSHPEEYASKHTSKGFYINSFLESARTLVHRIKNNGFPFPWRVPTQPTSSDAESLLTRLNKFFNEYPTLLFTRNHISDRDGNLKQRPVYAVDDLFLLIETMLTFPLLVQARKFTCCIMYGLETIRGSNQFLDHIAQWFKSYFSLDWSSFDQRLPRIITDCYYQDFLPRLIVINAGYQPTYEYPTYPDLDEHQLYTRIRNLLSFLHLWFNNMTFLSQDGYAYRRTIAGIPSGLLNTQYLGSFANLFLLIDALIEYGKSDDEIKQIILFILGDDITGLTLWSISDLEQFVHWFENYALSRYGMVLSTTKSVITPQRQNIVTLSYKCNFGSPLRPIGKLVAQLCYPEHGTKDKYMSYRAIGIAYAASGQDETFHNFCRDVYLTFLPYAAKLDHTTIENIGKYLPGYLKILDSYQEIVDLTHFPSLLEIRKILSTWKGPLSFTPKWNFSHFIQAPDIVPPSAKTLYEYELEHNINIVDPPLLPIG